MTLTRALLLCLTLIATVFAQAAEPARIGLVLAGGGARGLAHIGVIKYLEEQGIRADAVAGTSMGSVIGGLYASGMNAAEIEHAARTLDWRYAFDDSTPRDQLSFRRKQDDFDFLIGAKLHFKNGRLRLPMGAVEGQHLNFILHDLVAHVASIRDFDKLPIPYRAVASDIVTGDAVVLSGGDLAVAMRASMSIPGVFVPVDIGGKLLVDGGIAKNIPVDVVQAMGVDRLIVIDIGTPLSTRDKLDNVLSLMDQLTNIMTRKNSEAQLALMRPGDVLLSPDLDSAGVTTMAFEMVDEAISLGYAAAKAMAPQIAALGAARTPAERFVARPQEKLPVITAVRTETDSDVPEELISNMITHPLGQPLDKDHVETDIADIYGLEEFSRVDYEVLREESGHTLLVRATANPTGSSFLKLGLSWDQDSRGTSEFALRGSWRQKGINRLGAEWYTVAGVGGNSLFQSEFYQPLDVERRFFIDPEYRYQQKKINISEGGEVRARTIVDTQTVELGGGMNIGNDAQLRAGVFAANSDSDIEIGAPVFSSQTDFGAGYFAQFQYDTLDRPYFPGKGTRLISRYDHGDEDFDSDLDYDSWSTALTSSVSFGRTSITGIARWSEVDYDIVPGAGDVVPALAYTLGGFLNLSGFTKDSIAGNYRGLAGITAYRRLTDQSLLPVDFPVYAGFSLEAGNVWLRQDDAGFDDLEYAGSLYLGVDSPIGPVYLGVGLGEDDQRALYLQIGQLLD